MGQDIFMIIPKLTIKAALVKQSKNDYGRRDYVQESELPR